MSKWCRVSFVGQMIMNPDVAKNLRGWRNYRIEYFEPFVPYQDTECTIWLPATFDPYELEKEINSSIDKLIEEIPDTIQEEIEIFEVIKEKPKFMSPETAQKKIYELEEELRLFKEKYSKEDLYE